MARDNTPTTFHQLMYNNLGTKKLHALVAIPGLDQPLFRDVRAIAHA